MTLTELKREYEERRQALVEKLRRSPNLDAATQHQIYGAIKEIENFLQAIDYQVGIDQNAVQLDLSQEGPKPLRERTRHAASRVGQGTKRIFTEHIPRIGRRVTEGPRRYLMARRERKEMIRKIESELKARHLTEVMQPEEHVRVEPSGLSGTVSGVDVHTTPELESPVSVERPMVDDTLPPQEIPEATEKRKRKKYVAKGKAKRASKPLKKAKKKR